VSAPDDDVRQLFHRLNNQLGIILANAELLETRLGEDPQRTRAAQVVSGTLQAIATVQALRLKISPSDDRLPNDPPATAG
jgi:hypothetical protein